MYENLSYEDTNQLFKHSVVIYKKKPVYVNGVTEEHKLQLVTLSDRTHIGYANPSSKFFDFTPVRLGFCNGEKEAVFLSRVPNRTFKVGLSRENFNIRTLPNYSDAEVRKIYDLRSQGVEKCILGNYPPIEEALASLQQPDVKHVAVARLFAITSKGQLLYRTNEVGMINSENGKPIFRFDKKHLNTLWEDIGNAE